MADNEQNNDEYEFSDLEGINPETSDMDDETEQYERSEVFRPDQSSTVRRNAFIVVGVAVVLMLAYKFLGPWFIDKTERADTTPKPVQLAKPISQPKPIEPMVQSSIPQAPVEGRDEDKAIKQKLSAMDVGQQTMRSDLSSMSNRIDGLNSNVNELSDRFNKINQMLEQLSQQLEQQSADIARLRLRLQPKRVYRPSRPAVAPVTYNLQAVIPGRAWLIASNGSTITVREGTTIRGYGIVKLIDPIQGKVMTSSGKIIRFGQHDS